MGLQYNYRQSLQPVLVVVFALAAILIIASHTPMPTMVKGLSGYLPLHTTLETAAIVIAVMVFSVGWGVPDQERSRNSILLASVFLGVGLLDFLHTLSYAGMPDFITPSGPEKAINFWLMARLLSAFGLLAISCLSWRKLNSNNERLLWLLAVLLFTGVSGWIGLFHPEWVPRTFIQGQGLTTFKVIAEFFIIALYIVAAVRFLMQMRTRQSYDVTTLFGAVSVMALSEIFFTLYADVADVYNLLGHVYKVIAYGFIYKSIFIHDISEPYKRLSESKNLLQTVINTIPLRIFWKDRESRYLGCNVVFSKDAGESSPQDVVGKLDSQLAWQEQADLYRADDQQVIDTKDPKLAYEERRTMPNGEYAWVRTSKVPLVDSEDETIGVLGVYEDISNQKQMERNLQMAYSAIENTKNAHFWISPQGQVTYANDYACKSLGYRRDELVGMYVWDFDPDFPPEAQGPFWTEIKQNGIFNIESRHQHKDGTVFPVEVIANYICSDGIEQVFVVVHDITKRKQADETIWRQANFDPLTGLPNRCMFQDRLEQDIKKSNRTGLPLALMFLDLDYFKEVNDTLGHAKGDMLLQEAAARLASCVRETDTVARLGGDEFVILLSELENTDDADRVALSVLQKLSAPIELGDEVAYISASIGITFYPHDATETGGLLKNADQAMYAAKAAGRNQYSYFTPVMQAEAQSRMRLANELRVALAGNQLWVAYQPIIDLKSGKIIKAEALVRWQHPKLGMISPAEFIPIAEHTGLINEIGNWVFCQAAEQLNNWLAIYNESFQISVNMSPVQVNDKTNRFGSWHDQLQRQGLAGKNIVVEITEGLLLEANVAIKERLFEFRDAGIQVALDDFGTGYSSLSYLKKFHIDYIKIDKSFVSGLTVDSGDVALCEAMIVMAHKLGMGVIAEGVETREQLDILIEIGCDFAQGYLFSQPIAADKFTQLLQEGGDFLSSKNRAV